MIYGVVFLTHKFKTIRLLRRSMVDKVAAWKVINE